MLFQPTNISPSSFAGVGGDLVDATEGLTISWQVNGTSPLYGYRINFYTNDSASTQLFEVSEALDTPFYGTDGMGNPQMFSVNIPASTLAENNVVNGNENGYKYKIFQFWGPSISTQMVRQYGENYFICQAAPTVSITTDAITAPNTPITGTWSQEDGVGMDWVRWTVSLDSDRDAVILDSGIIHTQVLSYEYDGWRAPIGYYVTLYYQLQNGYQGSVSKTISAVWGSLLTDGKANAKLMAGCSDVLVTYPVPTYMWMENEGSTTATVENGSMIVPPGGSVVWSGEILTGEGGNASLVWSGKPKGTVTLTLTGDFENGGTEYPTLTITIPLSGNITAQLSGNGSVTETLASVGNLTDKAVTVIADGDDWYIVVNTLGAVFANRTTQIMPILNRTTVINGTYTIDADSMSIIVNDQSYDLTKLVSSEVFNVFNPFSGGVVVDPFIQLATAGAQECFFYGIVNGQMSDELLKTILSGSMETPEFDYQWIALSNFSNSSLMRTMGSIFIDGSQYSGLAADSVSVYRLEAGSAVMERIYDTSVTADMTQIIDFGAKTGKSYTYFVNYNLQYDDGNNHMAATMGTSAITPCGWDWILTTAQADENSFYHMTGEYRFGLDLGTEAISNNNVPSLLQNFTKYPTRQGVAANYRTGTLTAFIGTVDRENNVYIDTAAQSEAIMAISDSTDTKFLRTRKGEMWMVDTAGATTMRIGDKYREQPYKATLTWAETGSAENTGVICVPTDAAWPL